jgi:hypothetical protein
MTRWILLAVLVVAASATATIVVQTLPADSSLGRPQFPVADTEGPHPKAVVEGDLTYRFGSKAQNTTFGKDWVIRNEGDGELKLRLEEPPCSCTVAGFQTEKGMPTGAEKVIPPKGETKIHFTWETRENNGKYQKPATLLTNDPEHPELIFAAEGEVYPAVIIYPDARVDFSEISTDQKDPTATIYLFSRDRPELKLTKLATSSPKFFEVEQTPMTPEQCKEIDVKAGIAVSVKIKPGIPLAPFLEELKIETDHPKQRELRITITGKMVGPIAVIPERLRMVGISGKTGGKHEAVLLVRGHRPTEFEVERHPEKFKVEVQPGDNSSKSGKYRLIVTVPPGTPSGTFEDLIILRTDHPEARELRIPIHGYISEGDAG